MTEKQSPLEAIAEVAPKLTQLSRDVLFGDVWERPGLSKRDRGLVTVAVLAALARADQLAAHLKRALDNGVTRDEIGELITHIAFYSGWPTAAGAAVVAKGVFDRAGSG
jgi:4-carboxymuconolactone decarboxylase